MATESQTTGPAPVESLAPGQGSSKPRITPRNSIADEELAVAAKETPYNTLHQLANIIPRPTTPLRRASSAGPPSTHRSTRRTPAIQDRTPAGLPAPGSLRKHDVVTPHGRAARREAEHRRAAALTPGRERRRSGVQMWRESPRDNLRVLSRVLAPGSKVVELQAQDEVGFNGKVFLTGRYDDLEDEQEPRPRLSMPLDEDEDDSLLLPPLRSDGIIEDENLTQRSVEFPRRAVSLQPGGRLSRESFGSIRTSDRFRQPNEFGMDALPGDIFESSFLQQGDFDDYEATNIEEEATTGLRRPYLDDDTGRISLASGRTSDIRPQTIPEADTETTFVLPLPQRDSLASRLSVTGYDDSAQVEKRYNDTGNGPAEADDNEDSEIDQVDAEDVAMQDATTVHTENQAYRPRKSHRVKKRIKISRYGIQYPSLPVGVVKKLATTFLRTSGNSNAKLSKDTLGAIMQASDWFFEQVSDDLGAYAQHAGRKTMEETDVVTLMKR